MVLVSPSVKIYDFFFHCWHVGTASVPCRRSEKKEKKKKKTAQTSKSGESYCIWCPTRVEHQHDAKNGVLVQPR